MRTIRTAVIACLLSFSVHAQNKDMLDVKIGQMLMIGFPKAEVDPLVLEEIRSGKVGAIIFFEKNIPNRSSAFAPMKKMIWTYQKAAPIPLMVAIDQEGGKVNRMKEKYGFTRSITAQDMGKAGTLDSVQFYGEAIAATLAGVGVNVNFAPVVDVAVNPKNPVIVKNGRSFSKNPDSVALLAETFIKQHRKFGVATVLKHFPGHGSSMDDTHLGVADVTNTWTDQELIPYRTLLAKGLVDGVMSSHIVNKNLDPRGYPGTLSSRILDSLLRRELHYDGVVFSDDMQMQAITKEYGLEAAVKMAINAGIDVLCFSNNIQGSEERTVDKVHSIIRSLVESGQVKEERIDAAFNRVMRFKSLIGFRAEDTYRNDLERTKQELYDLKKSMEIKPEGNKEETKPAETVPASGDDKKKKKKKP